MSRKEEEDRVGDILIGWDNQECFVVNGVVGL